MSRTLDICWLFMLSIRWPIMLLRCIMLEAWLSLYMSRTLDICWLFMLSIRLSDMPRWWPIWLSIDMPIDGFMSEFIEGRSILMSLERRNWLWKCWVVAAEAPRRVARVAKTFMLMFEEFDLCVQLN